MCELAKRITVPVTMDFMSVSSYGAGTKSSGIVKIVKDLDQSIEGRDVLVVEDIIDSGRTLSHLMKILNERKPSSICLCTLCLLYTSVYDVLIPDHPQIYAYTRTLGDKQLLVLCNDSDTNVAIPAELQEKIHAAKNILIQNYKDTDESTLRPYEAVVDVYKRQADGRSD